MKALIPALLIATISHAQTLHWANGYGGIGGDKGNAIAVDADGNTLLTGSFSNSFEFGAGSGITLTSAGDLDIFVAKVGPDGTLAWAFGMGGAWDDTGNDIANQCPMVGGNAVFRARALYALIDDTQDFDDPLLCLQQGLIVKSVTVGQMNSVAVVPNPATDEASLVLTEEWDAPGVFVVYDALGAEVLRRIVPAYTPRYAFSTSSLAPAVYHYQVRAPSGAMSHGKLSIVR